MSTTNEPQVTYYARLLGKAKWESVSKAEFESYQKGSLYETKTEPVCEAAWYAEAISASNELGYAGMDAASVIRHLGETVTALKEANGQMADKLHKVTEVDYCGSDDDEGCGGMFLGVGRATKWCPFCGKKHEGETVKVSFTGDPAEPFQPVSEVGKLQEAMGELIPYAENEAQSLSSHEDCEDEAAKAWKAVEAARELLSVPPKAPSPPGKHAEALAKLRKDLAHELECLEGAEDLGALQSSLAGAVAEAKAKVAAIDAALKALA